jgi:hypothetical protein
MAASTRRKSTGTKRTESAGGNTRSSGSSRDVARRFVVCLSNVEAPASLEIHKIYPTIHDPGALKLGLLRVVDESGEDYLYPSEHFSEIKLPPKLAKVIATRAG